MVCACPSMSAYPQGLVEQATRPGENGRQAALRERVDKGECRLVSRADGQIFQRYEDREPEARRFIDELESIAPPDRAASPASSTSSFHSSRASPPPEVAGAYAPPDPNLPAPDVAPNLIPPSDLATSHRSLASLQQPYDQQSAPYSAPLQALAGQYMQSSGSRPQSLFSGAGGGVREPLTAYRGRPHPSLSYVPEQGSPMQSGPSGLPQAPPGMMRPPSLPPNFLARDYGTPDIPPHVQGHLQSSPYIPSPGYPQRPASASTFSHAPLNLPATLQLIHTSVQALHERLTALERTQAMLLRKEERRRSWFWSNNDEDELDDAELAAERERWAYRPTSTTVRLRRKKGLTVRVVWALITAVRRAAIGAGATMIVAAAVIALMNGGWGRSTREAWKRLRLRIVHALKD